MLFTKASEYALLSLIYIAKSQDPQDVDTMSNVLDIPKSFLAKILQALAKDNLLKSFKGAKGGFVLVKNPQEYTLKEIINSVEKKSVNVFECSNGVCPSHKSENCSLMPVLVNLQNKIDDFLVSITLDDIIRNNG
ncbi:Rrf2 family transcriptional regulator [Campylobacter insulaenigrae]|uniref:Transcriptional regulator, BadM/Rrf2 family n=2 Tax=Campylobacter insulaenigrae TaxID=260714 RepID=A0A0A8H113_9BACT|nr:Rrf2 family transcriptional regulator [Campylobacter insulaenigrae]AJC87873.1 transcriptional regulator, BadM/Rrf2 family [Campylobacter insulaenigrae NCTC 12927]MCR6570344.1 Rrf2 family transcriptional regulator [Campylobacter insulaenigrae]MCR6571746.1 Rrf2 family transcriptional regulator [Campylobacter insulaenigrae]MCR6573383.1 Rrf2 family transcriptional regulator [Campylobacter insulaenigrae]MCR6574848.1 Rrf2 family transcriptional regulator [Campylobacter insulaenigrae]